MRRLTVLFVLAGCSTPPGSGPDPASVFGSSLGRTLSVHVSDELASTPVVGASIDVGGSPATTDANGDATIVTSAPSVTLTVRTHGFVTERWIGVDRDHANVQVTRPLATRAVSGTISGGTHDLEISTSTVLPILRVAPSTTSTAPCAGGACTVSLTVDVPHDGIDVALVDGASVRVEEDAALDAMDHFAVDIASAQPVTLASFDVAFPDATGFAAVVGVPGVGTGRGVTLFARQTSSGSAMIPAQQGPFAGQTIWYIVRATTADTRGESMAFDRQVGQTPGHVVLPSAMLAVPTATLTTTLSIAVDPAATLYVVETRGSPTPMRAVVLHPSGARIDVPLDLSGTSGVVVRAVEGGAGPLGQPSLTFVERSATRIATLAL